MTIPERLRILLWCWGREYRHWLRSRPMVRRWLAKRARLRYATPKVGRITEIATQPTQVVWPRSEGETLTGPAIVRRTLSMVPGDFAFVAPEPQHIWRVLACGPQVNVSNSSVEPDDEPPKPTRHVTVVRSRSGRCYTVSEHYL